MAIQSGSRIHPEAQVYDVHVLAFPAASGRTVQGIMQLFGIDERRARHLIESVPVLLSQQTSAHEAEACAQALRKLGARAVVERSALAHTAQAHWSEPSPYEEDLVPRPVPVHQDTELEYDVLSAADPPHRADTSLSQSQGLRDPLDLELSLSEPDRMAEDTALRRPRQDALELYEPDYAKLGGQGLELDAKAAAPREFAGSKRPHHSRERTAEAREPTGARLRTGGPAPHSRAAVIDRPPTATSEGTRTVPLLQLGLALGVMATGYWTGSSVIFGTAGTWSVVAHGLALHQLVLGIRGLVS